MGYHVIIRKADSIERHYINDIYDLVDIDGISQDTIIYQAEETWKPYLMTEDEKYNTFLNENYRAGIKAQRLFFRQAIEYKLVPEELNQNKESLRKYVNCAEGKQIKRGDYLIRNLNNIEIEVKARTFYNDKNGQYFTLEYCELKKLENMEKMTGSPVLFAVYHLIAKDPDPNSLIVITLDRILELNADHKAEYIDDGKYVIVRVMYCKSGFDGLLKVAGVRDTTSIK